LLLKTMEKKRLINNSGEESEIDTCLSGMTVIPTSMFLLKKEEKHWSERRGERCMFIFKQLRRESWHK